MKILRIILRVLLCLLLVTPILGVLGVFPAPTADLYTPSGWAFMSALMASGYMFPLLGLLSAVCLVLFAIGRTALGAVLLAPMSVNVIFFHALVDTGLLHPSAIMGVLLFLLNAFFLWDNRAKYRAIW